MIIKSLSYSGISLWEQCPGKFVDSKKEDRPIAEATLEGSLFHDVVEIWMPNKKLDYKKIAKKIVKEDKENKYATITSDQYVGAIELLDDFSKRDDINPNTIHYELPFSITLPNGVPITGRIDRVDQIGPNKIRLVDYKTTRSFIYRNEVERSLQGCMYVLASRILFPNMEYEFMIDPIRFTPIVVSFSDSYLEKTTDYIEIVWNKILELKDGEAEYRVNRYCGYCQFRDTCAKFKDAAKNIYGEPKQPELKQYCSSIINLEDQIKNLTKLKDGYANALDRHIVAQGKRSMDFGDCYAFYKKVGNSGGEKLTCVKREEKV